MLTKMANAVPMWPACCAKSAGGAMGGGWDGGGDGGGLGGGGGRGDGGDGDGDGGGGGGGGDGSGDGGGGDGGGPEKMPLFLWIGATLVDGKAESSCSLATLGVRQSLFRTPPVSSEVGFRQK